jgi:Uma2 family endonuclease
LNCRKLERRGVNIRRARCGGAVVMSTRVADLTVAAEGDMVTHLTLGPGGLDGFLASLDDRRRPLIKYRDGSLTLVSPSWQHEAEADRLDALVKGVCAVLNMPYRATASTLFRRPGRDHGIEADKTYYLAQANALRGVRGGIDLSAVPPPDLVVEVVVSHAASKSLGVCQELGVAEVWVYRPRERSLEFLQLDARTGGYDAAPVSGSFPFLTPDDVLPWVADDPDEPDNAWEARLRAWVRDTLAPRRGTG